MLKGSLFTFDELLQSMKQSNKVHNITKLALLFTQNDNTPSRI